MSGRIIRALGNDVWLFSRWLVDGVDDLANSHAMLDRFEVLPPNGASYLLRVPPEGIPTESFWSFSICEPTADGKRVFVDNPIHRYSIGNRTPGLVRKMTRCERVLRLYMFYLRRKLRYRPDSPRYINFVY